MIIRIILKQMLRSDTASSETRCWRLISPVPSSSTSASTSSRWLLYQSKFSYIQSDNNTPSHWCVSQLSLSSNLKTCSQDRQNKSGVQRLWRGHHVHHHDHTLWKMYLSTQTYHKVSSLSCSPKLSQKIILWNWKAPLILKLQ